MGERNVAVSSNLSGTTNKKLWATAAAALVLITTVGAVIWRSLPNKKAPRPSKCHCGEQGCRDCRSHFECWLEGATDAEFREFMLTPEGKTFRDAYLASGNSTCAPKLNEKVANQRNEKLLNLEASFSASEAEVRKLRQLVGTVELDADGVRCELQQARKQLQDASREKVAAESKLGRLQSRLVASKEEARGLHARVTVLEAQVSGLQAQLTALQKQLHDAQQENEALQIKLDQATRAKVRVESANGELQVQVENKTENVKVLATAFKGVSRELSSEQQARVADQKQWTQREGELQSKLSGLTRVNMLGDEVSGLQAQLTALQKQLHDAQQENEALQIKLDQATRAKVRVESANGELQVQVENKTEDVKVLATAFKGVSRELSSEQQARVADQKQWNQREGELQSKLSGLMLTQPIPKETDSGPVRSTPIQRTIKKSSSTATAKRKSKPSRSAKVRAPAPAPALSGDCERTITMPTTEGRTSAA